MLSPPQTHTQDNLMEASPDEILSSQVYQVDNQN